jgi:SAM-dependent methyltransferase
MDSRLYPGYDGKWDGARFRRYILDRIREDYSVLDFGAGRGSSELLNFRGLVAFVAGVDPDSAVLGNPFLDEAKTLSPSDGRIPYPDDRFDLVFSDDVIEHLLDPETLFREAYRVLRPGGWLLAKTPNKRHYVPMIARFTPHRFHEFINTKRGVEKRDTFPTFYRCNTPEDVANHAQATGFEATDIQTWEGRPEYLRRWALTYLIGFLYERATNRFTVLSRFRCVMVFSLRKPARDRLV